MPYENNRREELLGVAKKNFGFVPNVLKEMSKSPAALECYMKAYEALSNTALTPAEVQVVMLAVSNENQCFYCEAAHKLVARMSGVEEDTVQNILNRSNATPKRDRALINTTRLLIKNRGFLSKEEKESIEQSGIDRPQLYEIIAIIGVKTITNYINHIAETPVDPQFS